MVTEGNRLKVYDVTVASTTEFLELVTPALESESTIICRCNPSSVTDSRAEPLETDDGNVIAVAAHDASGVLCPSLARGTLRSLVESHVQSTSRVEIVSIGIDASVGKSVLKSIYSRACDVFAAAAASDVRAPSSACPAAIARPDDACDVASVAIVLGTPLNYGLWTRRKRRLLEDLSLLASATDNSSAVVVARLRKEANFTALALACHPKATEAWEHRHWFVHTIDRHQALQHDAAQGLVQELQCVDQFVLVPRAVTQHPRNYPAWQYWRRGTHAGVDAVLRARWLLARLVSDPSDASAAFGAYEALGSVDESCSRNANVGQRDEVWREAWQLSQRLLRQCCPAEANGPVLAHEAVWVFRKAVVAASLRRHRSGLFQSSPPADRHTVCGGWTVLDEIGLAWTHAAASMPELPCSSSRDLSSASTLASFWVFFACQYGLWLCGTAAAAF
jgi:hypothetical protein